MFKKALFAAAILVVSSPAFVSAQDFFFSFDEFSRVPTTTVSSNTATGSLFIFADENLDFQQLERRRDELANERAELAGLTGSRFHEQ